MSSKIIYWFRNDLRLHDNEGFLKATQDADEVIPIYIFDPRQFKNNELGFAKTGNRRAQFLLESVQNLRDNLKKKGGNLVVCLGKPETVLSEMVRNLEAKAVYASKEATQEETDVESAVSKKLKGHNVDLELFWTSTLYHPRDMPFWISRIPDVFTDFRKAVERQSKIRGVCAEPAAVRLPVGIEMGKMPEIYELVLFSEPPAADTRSVLPFKGGETEALNRLNDYFWKSDQLKVYKETRNGLLGADYSSKFSAWLTLGCISPRYIYEELKRYEATRTANDSTYWLIFELIWRDYFRFVALKYGTRIFKTTGIKNDFETNWNHNRTLFDKWINGQTGVPFIDANMIELQKTGFMSNRGRQNVASFLAKDLQIDWTWGAAYFESQLLDYDPCSNWGNWNYVAGVGNDPRENRYFNIYTQATRYDEKGAYAKHWLPALQALPADKIHQPWNLSRAEQERYNVFLGGNYPQAIIPANKWLKNK
ncbi:MAG: DASH family cryptochrome [Runella slithyformis]|nr:MAG: DASH family cryptochrome [Runella slithyformis]TAF28662.1 MAG: DASH family cryptochrome [Runella slithyformis]TAF82379.1 MAG: DASH family cryptochrome [Runella slithyformis]